jgi:hypothetical protein
MGLQNPGRLVGRNRLGALRTANHPQSIGRPEAHRREADEIEAELERERQKALHREQEEAERRADEEAEAAPRGAESVAIQARLDLQARMWTEASLEQRRAWVSEADPLFRGCFVIDGPSPNPFLMAALKDAMFPKEEAQRQEAAA